MSENKPGVSISLIVAKPDVNGMPLILAGRRRYKDQPEVYGEEGLWELPGGSLDFGETTQHAAKRELLEETGLDVPEEKLELVHIIEYPVRYGQHWIGFYYYVSVDADAEPRVMEPTKSNGWYWLDEETLLNMKSEEMFAAFYDYMEKNGVIHQVMP